MPSKLSDLIWWPICKLLLMNCYHWKKMKLSIKNFFSKCDQIRRKPLIVIFSGKILNDRCVTRGGKGGGLPCPFSEIGKKCPKFWAKMPWLWPSMGCSFKMQFWRVSRKKRRFFLGKNSFSCCTWLFIKVPKFQENSPALKNFWLRVWMENFIFCAVALYYRLCKIWITMDNGYVHMSVLYSNVQITVWYHTDIELSNNWQSNLLLQY